MWTIRNPDRFRFVHRQGVPDWPGEDLQAWKCSFWMISIEFDHRLPAELPLMAENHWFCSQIPPQPAPGPTWGNRWILHRKFMFFRGRSVLNVFSTLLRLINHPHDTQEVSETTWYHGSEWDPHNSKIYKLVFFATKKNQFCSHPILVL